MLFEKNDTIYLGWEEPDVVFYMTFKMDIYNKEDLNKAIKENKIYVRKIDYEKDKDEVIEIKDMEQFKKYFQKYIERKKRRLQELENLIEN